MKKLFIFYAFLLMVFPAQAELPHAVSEALKKAGIPLANVAVFVQPIEASTPSISWNAEKSMNPASVMKLITAFAALDLLKPNYRWKTEVYRSGEVKNHVLSGDLIIKGYGDPRFMEADFRRLLVGLQQAGIKEIQGDLVLDKTYFEQDASSRKPFDGEIWRAYNAMPSAFLVNGRSTSFRFKAHEGRVNISQEVELPEVQIINHMQQTENACGDWRGRMRYDVSVSETAALVTFSGALSSQCDEKYLELSVFDDEKYAFFMFKKLWRELGGTFNGRLLTQSSMPSQAVKLMEQSSEPLSNIVREMNKWSNNVMARQLLLTIAAEKNRPPAIEMKGMEVIKNWLATKGGGYEELVIENGAGLSRIERISAANLGKMLVSAYHSPVMPELLASMPILSLDGTVQKRFENSPISGRAHLKTGSINGVSAIAGYLLDAQNHRHVMVMFVNHHKAAASKNAQDALISGLYQQP
ncbi:MAG: D-alanyl-D-alanine carboxypeptidase/D-alanyl-D-alanine endopeptidase [Methylophilaceae bacterium]